MSTVKHNTVLDSTTRLGIPPPTTEPVSLRNSVMALRTAVQEALRHQGDMMNSAVLVRDIIKLGLVAPEAIQILDRGGARYHPHSVVGISQGHQGVGPVGGDAGSGTVTLAIQNQLETLAMFDQLAADLQQSVTDLTNNLGDEVAARQQLAADLGTLLDTAIDGQNAIIATLQQDVSTLDGTVAGNTTAISGLVTDVSTLDGTVTAQAADITQLQTDLATAEGTLAGQATALTGLTTRVTTAEGDITSLAADVTTLGSTVGGLDAAINANASAITSLDTRVTSTESTLSSQASLITALAADVSDLQIYDFLETAVAGNAAALQGLEAQVVSAEGEISSMASEITSLQATVALLEGGQAALDAVNALTVRIDANELGITANASSITSLQGELTSLTGTVSGNASALSALTIRMTNAEGGITTQATQITTLQSDLATANSTLAGQATALSGLDTRVTNSEGNITAISSNLTSLTTAVNGNTASITTLSSSVDGLSSQYAVKIDINGFMSGFGLASTASTATPTKTVFSEFEVLADSFRIRHPGTTTKTSPFQVLSGVVWMQNVKIGNAVIDNLSVGKLTTGSLTAQVTQNADWIVGTGRIIWTSANNAFVKASGIGFGTSNQFLEWFGPRPTGGNLALCSEATAISYLKTNGDAYFGGSLSAGVLRNAATGTATASNAEVIVGPFGTNGGTKVVVGSYYFITSHAPSSSLSFVDPPTATVVLERRLGGGSWAQIGTQNFSGNVDYVPGFDEFEPGIYTATISGSFTVTDTNTSTLNFEYRLRLTARNVTQFQPGTIEQRLIVVSTEG